MFAVFTVTPSISPDVTGVSVRAKVDTTVVGSATSLKLSGTVIEDSTNTDGDVDGIGGGSAVPNSNGVIAFDGVTNDRRTLKWKYSLNGTAWTRAYDADVKMYFTDATPLEANVYDLALEKAFGYVDGDADIQGEINTGMDGDITYDPSEAHKHDLDLFTTGEGQCCCHAIVFTQLCRTVGVDAATEYVWGGHAADYVCWFWWQDNPPAGPSVSDYYCSFQLDKPIHDDAGADPHFTLHAESLSGGTYYDSSYGTTSLPGTHELAPAHPVGNPAATVRTGGGFPPSNQCDTDWECAHY